MVIGSGVVHIGNRAFSGCEAMTSVAFGENVVSIGECAFYESGLTEVVMGDRVESIGIYAFYKCGGLERVVLSNALVSIGTAAFKSCIGLTAMEIPASVEYIAPSVFTDCYNLKSLTFLQPTDWYYTNSNASWENKTSGTPMDLSDSSTAAVYFRNTYKESYWYKK